MAQDAGWSYQDRRLSQLWRLRSRFNGMIVHGAALVWGNNGDRKLKSVALASREIRTIVDLGPGIIDGLKLDKHGNYLVSHVAGKLYRVTPAGQVTRLMDVSARGSQLADFEYIPEEKMLVFPTLADNRLLGYRFAD